MRRWAKAALAATGMALAASAMADDAAAGPTGRLVCNYLKQQMRDMEFHVEFDAQARTLSASPGGKVDSYLISRREISITQGSNQTLINRATGELTLINLNSGRFISAGYCRRPGEQKP